MTALKKLLTIVVVTLAIQIPPVTALSDPTGAKLRGLAAGRGLTDGEADVRRLYPCRNTAKARVVEIAFKLVAPGWRPEHLMVLVLLREEREQKPFTTALDFLPALAESGLRPDATIWMHCSTLTWGFAQND